MALEALHTWKFCRASQPQQSACFLNAAFSLSQQHCSFILAVVLAFGHHLTLIFALCLHSSKTRVYSHSRSKNLYLLLVIMADHQPASPSMPPAIDSSQPAKSSQTTHVGATETPTGPIEEGADVAEGTRSSSLCSRFLAPSADNYVSSSRDEW